MPLNENLLKALSLWYCYSIRSYIENLQEKLIVLRFLNTLNFYDDNLIIVIHWKMNIYYKNPFAVN